MKEYSNFKVLCDKETHYFNADVLQQSEMHQLSGDLYQLRIGHSHYNARLLDIQLETGIICLKVGRKKKVIQIENHLSQLINRLGFNKSKSLYGDALLAPMPGLVLDVVVKPGQQVNKGDHLITLEAMKMENILRSQHAGVIKEIKINISDKVEKNQTLILFESPENEL